MEGKGNDALLKTTKVTEWNFDRGGYIPLAFGSLLLLGCIVGYVIAVARGNVEAILPLISDAAGSPPQNGLFGTLICLGGMCGVVFMIQRYMIVLEKNREKSNLVVAINRLSLLVGNVSMLGITLISGYPINFYRNRDVWLNDVGIPHMIGGVTFLSLGLCYVALQCILTLFLKKKNESMLSLRVLLLFICTSAFVYHMITVPEYFGGVSHLYYMNDTIKEVNYTGILPYPSTMGASLRLPIETGGSYVSSAIAEWIFVFFFCCFFFTFFKEAQDYSLLIVIETHNPRTTEVTEDLKPDFRKMSLALNGSQIDAKPPPEVRKVLRRDSTCQTMTDLIGEVLPSKKVGSKANALKTSKINGFNEKKKLAIDSEVDRKLNQILSKCEDPVEAKKAFVAEHSISTSCDDLDCEKDKEEERKAIEKIDIAVKDAENDLKTKQESTNGVSKKSGEAHATAQNKDQSTCPMSVQ